MTRRGRTRLETPEQHEARKEREAQERIDRFNSRANAALVTGRSPGYQGFTNPQRP